MEKAEKYAYEAIIDNGNGSFRFVNPILKSEVDKDKTYFYPTYFNGIATINKVTGQKVEPYCVSNNFLFYFESIQK